MNNSLPIDTSKPFDIVCIGRCGVDLVPCIGPVEDAHTYNKFVGGSPAITVSAAAMQGCKTGFISKIGKDIMGRFVVSYLKSIDVDTSYVSIAKDPSACTAISIMELKGLGVTDGVMYRSNAADLYLSTADINEEYISKFKILLFSGTSLCHSPSREAVMLAVEYAKRNNVCVAFDPDYRSIAWPDAMTASIYYWLMAQKADIIISTRDEFDIIETILGDVPHDDASSAARLLNKGVSLICIKHGDEGSMAFTTSNSYRGCVYPGRLVTSNGAGDCFAGNLLSVLVRGGSVDEALKHAAASAALTISGKSCTGHLPSRQQTLDFIRICDSGNDATLHWWDPENGHISDML